MLEHLIPLLPLQIIPMRRNRQKLFYVFKLIRIRRGLSNFKIGSFMLILKKRQMRHLNELIKNDLRMANSQDQDNTNLGTFLFISFILKLIKIMIFVSSVCYFFAMAFKFLLDIQNDYLNFDEYSNDEYSEVIEISNPEHFSEWSGLKDMNDYEAMIVLVYFSFTSLTTVGFGDFNPRSDTERIFVACGLLFGVSIFSYIVSELIEVIEKFFKHNQSGNDDELNKFFELLRSFNQSRRIDHQLKVNIEKYFLYRWENDKNQVFDDD